MPNDLYTLAGEEYYKEDVIEEYQSLIWTERFVEAGEVQLVISATEKYYDMLAPGTLLSLNGSREVMVVDSRETEEGMCTVKGKTLEAYFGERYVDAFEITDKPGHILAAIVQNMIDRADAMEIAVDKTYIPRLSVGALDEGDAPEEFEKIAYGPAYPELLRIAQKYAVDMHTYLVSSDSGGSEIHFSTYVGQDRLRPNGTDLVRFAPSLDNFDNIQEVRSDAGYKSAVIALCPTGLSVSVPPIKASKVPDHGVIYHPFLERIVEITPNIVESDLSGITPEEKEASLTSQMDKAARLRLKAEEKTDVVGGEIVPVNPNFTFAEDDSLGLSVAEYRLGDRVEVVGNFGQIRTTTVSEYVRAFDNTGLRAYPTFKNWPIGRSDPPILD